MFSNHAYEEEADQQSTKLGRPGRFQSNLTCSQTTGGRGMIHGDAQGVGEFSGVPAGRWQEFRRCGSIGAPPLAPTAPLHSRLLRGFNSGPEEKDELRSSWMFTNPTWGGNAAGDDVSFIQKTETISLLQKHAAEHTPLQSAPEGSNMLQKALSRNAAWCQKGAKKQSNGAAGHLYGQRPSAAEVAVTVNATNQDMLALPMACNSVAIGQDESSLHGHLLADHSDTNGLHEASVDGSSYTGDGDGNFPENGTSERLYSQDGQPGAPDDGGPRHSTPFELMGKASKEALLWSSMQEENSVECNASSWSKAFRVHRPDKIRERGGIVASAAGPCFTASYCGTAAPEGKWTRCVVERIRNKGNGRSSKFVLRNDREEILLAAKRNKMERVIRFYRPNYETHYSDCVGLAHYDSLGSQFVLRGADVKARVATDALMALKFGLSREGPREVVAVLPLGSGCPAPFASAEDLPTLGGATEVNRVFGLLRKPLDPTTVDHMQILRTVKPVWNKERKTFGMDFGGRVQKSSVKNMKLEVTTGGTHDAEEHELRPPRPSATSTVFMCGRLSESSFVCDFKAPLTPLEAFFVAVGDLIHKPVYHWM